MTQYSQRVLQRTTKEFREALDKSDGSHHVLLSINLLDDEPMPDHRLSVQERIQLAQRQEATAAPVTQLLEQMGFLIKPKYSRGIAPGEAKVFPLLGAAEIHGTRDQILRAIDEIPGVTVATFNFRVQQIHDEVSLEPKRGSQHRR
jgi:hypothetical protein